MVRGVSNLFLTPCSQQGVIFKMALAFGAGAAAYHMPRFYTMLHFFPTLIIYSMLYYFTHSLKYNNIWPTL